MKSTHNTARAYGKSAIATICMVTGTAFIMAACSTAKPSAKEYSQDKLVDSIRMPAGNVVALETTGVGVLNYEYRTNVAATWTHDDGSTVVGTQIAIAPAIGGNNIAVQLSKGAPGMNAGNQRW